MQKTYGDVFLGNRECTAVHGLAALVKHVFEILSTNKIVKF